MTVEDAIIIPAMQHINRLRPGDIPGNDDASAVLLRLNYLVDRWNAKRLCLSGLDTFWLPLVAHKGEYTIGVPLSGPAADFPQTRPSYIQNAVIKIGGIGQTGGLEYPIKLATPNQWEAIEEKFDEALLPDTLFFDYDWPVGKLRLHSVPLCVDITQLKIMAWRALAPFALLTTPVALSIALTEALIFNLALRIAPLFQQVPSDYVRGMATESMADLMAYNAQTAGMPMPAAA